MAGVTCVRSLKSQEEREILLEPQKARKVVLTAAYLHNFLRKRASRDYYMPTASLNRNTTNRTQTALESLQTISTRAPDRLLCIRNHVTNDLYYNPTQHFLHQGLVFLFLLNINVKYLNAE